MSKRITFGNVDTLGLDVGDRFIQVCEVRGGVVVAQRQIPTSRESLTKFVAGQKPCRVVIEVGKHSPWMSDLFKTTAFEAIFVNAARLMTLHELKRKTDKLDARYLASRGSLNDAKMFESRVEHRVLKSRAAMTLIRSRDVMVRSRTRLVTSARSMVDSYGGKLPSCAPESFTSPKVVKAIPKEIFEAIEPMIGMIKSANQQILKLEKKINKLAQKEFPQVAAVSQVQGVGNLTGLAFTLVVDDVKRFKNGRLVGAYLGLTPGIRQSGEEEHELGITKEGDDLVRRLLVQAANYIVYRGEDSDLRRFGERIIEANKRTGKKRAVIAVARKLAVVLFHLLKTGDTYDPLYHTKKQQPAA
jgi:transposase